MAWLVCDLEGTLVEETEEGEEMPVEGALEAMQQLAGEGHRLTVFTDKFAPMPLARRQQMKEEIERALLSMGFPEMEVWTGTTKPAADIFIGQKDITFDGDWGLALAQAQVMMEDQGLLPGPMPDDGSADFPEEEGGGAAPPQGEPPPEEPPQA